MDKTRITKDLENKTLRIERTFNAPKEKVWRAYADKDWFEKWWGPEGWEAMTKTFDFKAGGTIHYGMKCVDKNQGEYYGQESWGLMRIETVDEPNAFTVTDYFSDTDGNINQEMPSQKMIVELAETDGRTTLISRSVLETVEQLEELVKMGMAEGFSSQLNRLETLLKD